MKITLSDDWCRRMVELEGDSEIGAGLMAMDPEVEEKLIKSWRPSRISILISMVADVILFRKRK